ncbi:MAG: hypothetical protein J3R72DRAFT_498541 [Linnemannia gamsii]|nr:MAG: hypothetical protein J3R72DRAFT_498541 [Linnemannia gamsii]
MSSPKIISANDFALLLGGVASFFSTHSQLSTVSQQDYLYQQQQQQSSRAQLHHPPVSYSIEPETCPPVTTAAECDSGTAHETSAGTRENHVTLSASPEHESFPQESVHNNTNDSHGTTVVGASIQRDAPVLKPTPAASSNSTKEYQPPALATNATEFIANFAWDLMPVTLSKDISNQSAISTRLSEPKSATAVPRLIKDRSVDSHPPPTRDVPGEHYDKKRSKSYVESKGEILDDYNRHPARFQSDPYSPTEMMPGPDNGHSAQVILERLQSHQGELIRTNLTEEEKLALIEHGRTIGNRRSWDHEHNQRNNNCTNNINHHRQQRQRTNSYLIDPSLRRRSGSYQPQFRSRITYSRDFLMTFSGLCVPPDSIDRIRWIQQHATLDWSQKSTGLKVLKSQQHPIQQSVRQRAVYRYSGDDCDQGTRGSNMGRRHTTGGGGRGEMNMPSFPMPQHQQNPPLYEPQEPTGLRAPPSQQQYVFQDPINVFQGSYRPEQGRLPLTGEGGGEMGTLSLPILQPQVPTALKTNVHRSDTTASGSLR